MNLMNNINVMNTQVLIATQATSKPLTPAEQKTVWIGTGIGFLLILVVTYCLHKYYV